MYFAHHAYFLELLAEVSSRFAVGIHAYVLMGNHYHLLVQTRSPHLGSARRAIEGKEMRGTGPNVTLGFEQEVVENAEVERGRLVRAWGLLRAFSFLVVTSEQNVVAPGSV